MGIEKTDLCPSLKKIGVIGMDSQE